LCLLNTKQSLALLGCYGLVKTGQAVLEAAGLLICVIAMLSRLHEKFIS
jgi:hypothetical protein